MYKKNSVQYSKLYEYHMRCFIVAGCWLLYRSTTVPYILQLYMEDIFHLRALHLLACYCSHHALTPGVPGSSSRVIFLASITP